MNAKASRKSPTLLTPEEKKRRKRELIIIVVILVVVGLLTIVENRIIRFGAGISVSNSTLMFILINLNLLLLILLLFLVFRNLVKLLYDRRRRIMGARLRTKLVVTFVALSLLPTIILFFFAISFITTSIEFWFNVPIEQALENSLQVGRQVYALAEENNRFYLERIAYQVKTRNLLQNEQAYELEHYVQVVQRAFNLDGVEVYSANANRLAMAVSPQMNEADLPLVSADNLQKQTADKAFRTITRSTLAGELIRTISTIPFRSTALDAQAFVVVNVRLPPDLAIQMNTIAKGFEEYQQIVLLKRPIRTTYYITLSIVALLVVFCAIWFGFYLAKTITIPIMALANGTRRVAEGDLTVSIAPVADDEIGSLVTAFNKMTRDLRINREQLEQSAQKLREQNIEIEERRQYMEVVLKNISTGVITIDAAGNVTTINKSATRLWALDTDAILNRNYRELLREAHQRLASEIMDKLAQSHEHALELPLKLTIKSQPRTFLLTFSALRDDTGNLLGTVMVFDDLTELEKAERMAAWREVARRIAHEVKNPLTPITLSAQRLIRKYSRRINDPVFDECTRMIIDHVDLIRNLVNEFSAFARFPTANPKPCRLLPIIEETVDLYREGHPEITFKMALTPNIPLLNLDRQQIKQAMINLIENAIAAIKDRGTIDIRVAPDAANRHIHIEVADNGSGLSDEAKTRLFEPNFSTKQKGMGLGLTIVNSIIVGHNGRIRAQDNHPRGARFIIELPV